MNARNHVQLIGHLGQDPEFYNGADSKNVAKFSMATNHSYKDSNGNRVTKSEWHNIVIFGSLADIVQKYVKKGSNVLVHGSLRTRSYESKEGHTKYTTEIVASDILFMDNKQ